MVAYWAGRRIFVGVRIKEHRVEANNRQVPGTKEIINLYEQAGRPKQFRGFATNVANYNAWDLSPGEFETTRETPQNRGKNEKSFIELIAAQLANTSVPNHAITDTSRNAVQGLRLDWGGWCNVNGAGFGIRPTNKTGNKFLDAFVWAKNGGISDGTTDVMDAHYDSFCGRRDGEYQTIQLSGQM